MVTQTRLIVTFIHIASLVVFHSLKLCIKAPSQISRFSIPNFHFARCNIETSNEGRISIQLE